MNPAGERSQWRSAHMLAASCCSPCVAVRLCHACVCLCMCLCLFNMFKDIDSEGLIEDLVSLLKDIPHEEAMQAQCYCQRYWCVYIEIIHLLMLFVCVYYCQELNPQNYSKKGCPQILIKKKAILLLIAKRNGGPMYCVNVICIFKCMCVIINHL